MAGTGRLGNSVVAGESDGRIRSDSWCSETGVSGSGGFRLHSLLLIHLSSKLPPVPGLHSAIAWLFNPPTRAPPLDPLWDSAA